MYIAAYCTLEHVLMYTFAVVVCVGQRPRFVSYVVEGCRLQSSLPKTGCWLPDPDHVEQLQRRLRPRTVGVFAPVAGAWQMPAAGAAAVRRPVQIVC